METGPSPIFFPEDSTKILFELAGLLARLAFCGLPGILKLTNHEEHEVSTKFHKECVSFQSLCV
jgi:hypothetical protein